MEEACAIAPAIEMVTDPAGLAQPNDIKVVPAIFQVADGERYPGIVVALETSEGPITLAFDVEQWVELQLRGESAAHEALLLNELLAGSGGPLPA